VAKPIKCGFGLDLSNAVVASLEFICRHGKLVFLPACICSAHPRPNSQQYTVPMAVREGLKCRSI
jgi:hypothetical protein